MNATASNTEDDRSVRTVNVHTRGCLALNASYEPLDTIPVKRAMRLVLEGRAEIVEADEARAIRSENAELPYPVVIRLVKFVHVPRKFRRNVNNTFLHARDGYACGYCGRHKSELRQREFLTRDHVIPQSRFATKQDANTWDNCVTACNTCNNRKANLTPKEAGMALRVPLVEPHFVALSWVVRKLTPLQRKYIAMFYGDDTLEAIGG